MKYALVIYHDDHIHRVELYDSERRAIKESVIWEIIGYSTAILYAERIDNRTFSTRRPIRHSLED